MKCPKCKVEYGQPLIINGKVIMNKKPELCYLCRKQALANAEN